MKYIKIKTRIIPIIFAILAGMFLLLFYGPFPQFRLIWINTAMYSGRHQFLATVLYPRTYINKVLDIPFPTGKTYPELLQGSFDDTIHFAELKGDYFRGYILKIDDPRRLALVSSGRQQGKCLFDIVTEHKGLGGVNGAGFRNDKKRGLPWGTLIIDSTLVSACTEHREHTIGGLTNSNKLLVGRMNESEIMNHDFMWAFEFGPILIINGEKTTLNSYSGGFAPRTAIGQTKEGHILLVVIDGRQFSSIGATHNDVQMILYENGAINAIGLDGGSSSCMVYEGKPMNSSSGGSHDPFLPNALVFR